MTTFIFESNGELVDSIEMPEAGNDVYDEFLENGAPGRYLLSGGSGNWYKWILLNQTTGYHWWTREAVEAYIPAHLRAMALLLK